MRKRLLRSDVRLIQAFVQRKLVHFTCGVLYLGEQSVVVLQQALGLPMTESEASR